MMAEMIKPDTASGIPPSTLPLIPPSALTASVA